MNSETLAAASALATAALAAAALAAAGLADDCYWTALTRMSAGVMAE
jgi:hypothetical protein